MSSVRSGQSILSRFTPYSRAVDRVYTGLGRLSLPVEHSYQVKDLNAIQIATEFYSDKCNWSYVGEAELGDLGPENLGKSEDTTTFSKVLRFQSSTAETSHKLRVSADEDYLNGYHPNIIYIGNHNLEPNDYIIFKAYSDSSFTTVAYSFRINYYPNEIFNINKRPFSKYKYYELEFVCATAKVIKVGRIILAGSLPTNATHNAQTEVQMGWTDHKEEMVTESKTRFFNRQFWAKKLNFQIQINLEDSFKLSDQLQNLIQEGTGSRPFLVVLNPNNPNFRSIYGVLTDYSTFEQKELKYGLYTFDVEEIQ